MVHSCCCGLPNKIESPVFILRLLSGGDHLPPLDMGHGRWKCIPVNVIWDTLLSYFLRRCH